MGVEDQPTAELARAVDKPPRRTFAELRGVHSGAAQVGEIATPMIYTVAGAPARIETRRQKTFGRAQIATERVGEILRGKAIEQRCHRFGVAVELGQDV